MPKKIAVYALTAQGIELSQSFVPLLKATLFVPVRFAKDEKVGFDSLRACVAENFAKFDGHIFIAATGIVVRLLAPVLQTKDVDPAVVVLDQLGEYAISLLSGHLGGGNELAKSVAICTQGQAVITTATDSLGVPSIDLLAQKSNLHIVNIGQVKYINSALIAGETVQVYDPHKCLRGATHSLFSFVDREGWNSDILGVWVSDELPDKNVKPTLHLAPSVLMLGIGCRRGVSAEDIFEHIATVFELNNLSMHSIAGIGSIDLKADEKGLLETAQKLGVTPVFMSREKLNAMTVPNPSSRVQDKVGVLSVSEASALVLAHHYGKEDATLIIEKTKSSAVTLAVAR